MKKSQRDRASGMRGALPTAAFFRGNPAVVVDFRLIC
jgi:hypothetical protein